MTKSTKFRHQAIKQLIQKFAINDQNQLVDLLKEHFQIEANQAVISRDLRKLSIVKRMVNETLCYEVPNLDVKTEILRLALVDITHNEATIVILTHPALADFVGDCLDAHDDLDILGCVSGENTILVTPTSIKTIKQTYEKICERLHFKKSHKNV